LQVGQHFCQTAFRGAQNKQHAACHAVCKDILDFYIKGMDLKLFENVLAAE